MNNGGGRVSIPRSMRKTIENIKEIAGSHGDEEVYLMLKECNMDPNETAHKLLFQDTFHEVKRKRDRKKENVKESAEPRAKPGIQMNKGGQGNHTARYSIDDAGGGGWNSVSVRENGTSQVPVDRVAISTVSTSQATKNKEASKASSSIVIIDASVGLSSQNTSGMHAIQSVTAHTDITKLEDSLLHKSAADTNKTVPDGTHVQLMPSPSNTSTSGTSLSSSGVCSSHSEPVLEPSQDLRPLGAMVDTRNQATTSQLIPVTLADSKPISVTSEVCSSFMQETVPSMSQVACENQLSESSQAVTSTHNGPPVSRPLSNYGGRSPQIIVPQKVVGRSKEWKAKPTNSNLGQGTHTALSLSVSTVTVEAVNCSLPAVSVIDGKQTSSELEKKLQESHISDSQHVIIPKHLHVPEVEKLGFRFGSFDANFGLNTSYFSYLENDKSPSISEISDDIEEDLEGTSNQDESVNTKEEDYPPSSSHVPETFISGPDDVLPTSIPEYIESKQEKSDLSPGFQQYSTVHMFPNYNFGLMPPVVGSQVPPVNSNESQNRDVSPAPSFVVQQPFDSTSYYAQFYQSSADNDGRVSPFHAPVISTDISGNMTVLPPQASQSSEEASNNIVLPTAGPIPLVTQAAGVMQSTIALTQPPLPVFRQPAGMHFPHYPNYIPYAPYYPFYVAPPAMHHFLNNGAFPPPQAQAGSVYPAPPVSSNKHSLPQNKPGSNTGNSNHMGMSDNYGLYSSSPASVNPHSATTTGHSTSSEDHVTTQLKENNLFIAGQQSEVPAVWIHAQARDIPGLQASTFYNLPQAQMAFTATQGSHGSFTGIYHPAQPVTGAAVHPLLQQSHTIAGTTASVYQPSQPAPVNWPNNC